MEIGDVCLVNLMSYKGHEQKGLRPVIIISKKIANLVLVVPLTSNIEALKYDFSLEVTPSKENGLNEKSVAMIFQLRVIDTRKIIKQIGIIENQTLSEIKSGIKEMVEIK